MPSNGGNSQSLRRIGLMTATLLVMANMIGTGIFTTTGFMVQDLGSSVAVLAGWLVGGLLALCGALAYAELVAAIPKNGGEYALLSRIFHPSVGFVAGWISLVVGFSAPIAASALAFGEYLGAVFPPVEPALAAAVLVIILSTLHGFHVTLGGNVQNGFTLVKILLILVFIGGGLFLGDLGRIGTGGVQTLGSDISSPEFAIALVFVYFAYSGWNGAAYLAGEVKNPSRTLPWALMLGTTLVMLLYLGLNVIFLSAAGAEELSGVVEVGHVAAVNLFGARAGILLSGGISLALISSVSAMIMAGPRVYQAMGEDHVRLGFLNVRTRRGGPAWAVALQAAVALLMVATASFGALLTYIGFTLSLSAGLTVVGLLVLRRREPELARPYRVWAYPFTPLLFVTLSSWIVVHAIVQRPIIALAGLTTIASGLGMYAWFGRNPPRPH